MQRHHTPGAAGVYCTRSAFEVKNIGNSIRKDCNSSADHVDLWGSGNVFVTHTLETEGPQVSVMCDSYDSRGVGGLVTPQIPTWYQEALTQWRKLRHGQTYQSL